MNKSRLAEYLKHRLPPALVKVLRAIDRFPQNVSTWRNRFRRHQPIVSLLQTHRKVHLGCGHVRLPGYLNVDCQQTGATDYVADCSHLDWLPRASCDVVYSHSFLEHIPQENITDMLLGIRRVLVEHGFCIMLGIPDFRSVASAYLANKAGNTGHVFDLREVYRYTHGDPGDIRNLSSYLAQLHKTLFDIPMLKKTLIAAGFKSIWIIRYSYRDDPVDACLGFMASHNQVNLSLEFFTQWLHQNTPFLSNIRMADCWTAGAE